MTKEQAFAVIKNLIDQAFAGGVIKNIEHSANVIQALQVLQKELSKE